MTAAGAAAVGRGASAPVSKQVDHSRGVLIAVSLALFCIQVDFFALNLALPDMARSFHVGATDVQWTVSAYLRWLGSQFILAGRVGYIFGRRLALLGGIAAFGIASAVCAVALSVGVLVASRVLQGAGAAVIFPVGIAPRTTTSNRIFIPPKAQLSRTMASALRTAQMA